MTIGTGNEKELVERLTQITLKNLENENFGGKELAVHAGISGRVSSELAAGFGPEYLT